MAATRWTLLLGAIALGCVRTFPQHVADDDRGVHVYAVEPGPTGEAGVPLEAPAEQLPSAGLTLVAQWGDDRGLYDAVMQRGPSLPNGRHVLFNASSLLVVDTTTGAPLRRLRWAANVRRVAVDPAGRFVATLDARGAVALGELDGDGPAPLAVAPRAAAARVVSQDEAPASPRFDSVSTVPWRGGDADRHWPTARVAERLFFSRDGARLVGVESVWDVATRRPLLPLREGEALLAVDASARRAAVATLAVRTTTGSPGSQCGFVPTSSELVVAAAEERDLVGDGAPRPLTGAPIDGPVADFDEPGGVHPDVVAMHPVGPLALSAQGDVAVAVGDRAWWIGPRGARALMWPRRVRSVRSLAFTPHGLAAQADFDGGSRTIVAVALFGRDGRTRQALSGGSSFAPDAAGRVVVRDEGWSLWDLGTMERVRALPDPGALRLSAVDQASSAAAGAVVLRDELPQAHALLVSDGDRWRRVEVAGDGSVRRWSVSPDGGHAALYDARGLRVVDLRDGRVRWQREQPAELRAMTLAGERLYVGDERGAVEVLSLDGAVVARLDLSARFDHATALAASPDGATVAVGTARSRVFVFRAGGR